MGRKIEDVTFLHGFDVTYLPETTSTNDVARTEGFAGGTLIVADSQTKGRGQRGNSWHSDGGENLTFSLVVEPVFLPVECQFVLSQAVSLAVADALAEYGIDASVKWPNDIYVGDRKIAGILIENDICGATLSRSIIGIGLNVNQKTFDAGLPNPVSMAVAAGNHFDRVDVLDTFCRVFSQRYMHISRGGRMDGDYRQRLYLLNVPHEYKIPSGESFEGIIREVRPTGELMVEHPDKSVKGYLFKEIEF